MSPMTAPATATDGAASPALELRGVRCAYGELVVLEEVSFSAAGGAVKAEGLERLGQCGAGGMTGPWGRHHDRGACRDPVVQRLEDSDIGGVARSEVVAGDDHQTVVGPVPETFGEGDLVGHRGDATGRSGRAGRPEPEP